MGSGVGEGEVSDNEREANRGNVAFSLSFFGGRNDGEGGGFDMITREQWTLATR